MNKFTFSYPTKVYFGEGAAADALKQELPRVGKTVMLAYGGGSLKKNGIYDELKGLLQEAGKEVVDFSGIMSNPTYAKVQEGAALAREQHVDFILAAGGGSVVDCCKVISAQAVMDEDIWSMEYTEEKFTRFAKEVFGEDTAEAGLKALSSLIEVCGLPTKLGQLKSRVPITQEVLRQVADTCNIIKCNPRELSRGEIYEILCECM